MLLVVTRVELGVVLLFLLALLLDHGEPSGTHTGGRFNVLDLGPSRALFHLA